METQKKPRAALKGLAAARIWILQVILGRHARFRRH
jgi:hypothetical protein